VYFVNCTMLQLSKASVLNFVLGGNIRQSKHET